MGKFIQLEPNVWVSPQLTSSDFAELAARGFRSVVNNRPDGEAPDQLPDAQAETAARQQGLEYRYQPVNNANITDDETVSEFARLMCDLPGPVLFYCRSGTRCTTLWAQASAARLGVDPALEIARKAGYNLDGLRGILADRSSQPDR